MGRTSKQTWGMFLDPRWGNLLCAHSVSCAWFSLCPRVFTSRTTNNVKLRSVRYPDLWLFKKNTKKQGLAEILHQKFSDTDVEERHHTYLKPFRVLVSLLDKPEIGNVRSAVAVMGPLQMACVRRSQHVILNVIPSSEFPNLDVLQSCYVFSYHI